MIMKVEKFCLYRSRQCIIIYGGGYSMDNNEKQDNSRKLGKALNMDDLEKVTGGGRTEESYNDPSQDDWYTEDGNGWTISPC